MINIIRIIKGIKIMKFLTREFQIARLVGITIITQIVVITKILLPLK